VACASTAIPSQSAEEISVCLFRLQPGVGLPEKVLTVVDLVFERECHYANPVDHLSDDALEQYALGNPIPHQAEEHLLICPICQERMWVEHEFTKAIRSAAAQYRGHRRKRSETAHG